MHTALLAAGIFGVLVLASAVGWALKQRVARGEPHGHHALLPSLAQGDEVARIEVDVGHAQADQLGDPQPGRVQGLDHREVADLARTAPRIGRSSSSSIRSNCWSLRTW